MNTSSPIVELASFDWKPLAFGLAAGGLLFVVSTLVHRAATRERRRRFLPRQPCGEDEWFESYYPCAVEERSVVLPALQELGKLLGIQWTQLRPDDKFSGSLRLKYRFFTADEDELDDMSEWVESWTKRNGVSLKLLGPCEDELGRFLDQLRAAYRQRTKQA